MNVNKKIISYKKVFLADRHTSVPVRFYVGHKNVGDLFGPKVIEFVSKSKVFFQGSPQDPHILGLGSIIDWSTRASYVWGSGMIDDKRGFGGLQAKNVWALRGKLTWSELRRGGISIGDVPLGDPGLFVGEIFKDLCAGESKKYELGIIPHYADQDNVIINKLRLFEECLVLDVSESPKKFIEDLCLCKNIISSSLHGLVFAEALNIPNAWIELSDNVYGNGFKFRDWFSISKSPSFNPLKISPSYSTKELIRHCRLHDFEYDLADLKDAVSLNAIKNIKEKKKLHHGFTIENPHAPHYVFLLACNDSDLLKMFDKIKSQITIDYLVILGPKNLNIDNISAGCKKPKHIHVSDDAHMHMNSDLVDNIVINFFTGYNLPPMYAIITKIDDEIIFPESYIADSRELLDNNHHIGSVGYPTNYKLEHNSSDDVSEIHVKGRKIAYVPSQPDEKYSFRRPMATGGNFLPCVSIVSKSH